MTTSIPVLVSHDKGEEVYDTVVTARTIHRMFTHGLIEIDDERQRGRNTVSGKPIYSQKKVDRWTEQLLNDEAVFGQLTWNFRPEETNTYYDPDEQAIVIEDGSATLPDSAHRHRSIAQAVESVARGSNFDLDMRFSVRIWRVPAEAENEIFYGMNQEGDKADATRSKYLMQRNSGEKIARELVRRARDLTEGNVETISNTLSAKNHRLTAFNTIAVACERNFNDTAPQDIDEVVTWLADYWAALVEVRPELGILSLQQRQAVRKSLLSASALAIHGYIGLARRFRDGNVDLDRLKPLAPPTDGGDDYFALTNPEWQTRGILVPSQNKAGETKLTMRNANQTRRAVVDALAELVGLDGAVSPPARQSQPALINA
ncbi:MAG: DNA sulfur modification protein DndB [Solirubrobacteraceae bacterium]